MPLRYLFVRLLIVLIYLLNVLSSESLIFDSELIFGVALVGTVNRCLE